MEFNLPLIATVGVALYVIYLLFFGQKGNVVYIEWYKLINDRIIRHQPNKIIKGKNIRKDGVEKLIVPRSVTRLPIEGYHPRDLHPTNSAIPIVKILEIGQDQFTTIRDINVLNDKELKIIGNRQTIHTEIEKNNKDIKTKDEFLATYEQYIVEKDVAYWSQNIEEELKERHKEGGWKKYLPYAVVMVAIIIAGGLTYWSADKSFDHIEKAQQQSWEEAEKNRQQSNLILDLSKKVTSGELLGEEKTETDADKPPAQGGGQ